MIKWRLVLLLHQKEITGRSNNPKLAKYESQLKLVRYKMQLTLYKQRTNEKKR